MFGGPSWLVGAVAGVISVVGVAGAGAVARGPAGVEEGAHRLMRMGLEVVYALMGLVCGGLELYGCARAAWGFGDGLMFWAVLRVVCGFMEGLGRGICCG